MNTHTHTATVPILDRLVKVYKLWHEALPHIPKDSRYTLGVKVDMCLVDTIESIFIARFISKEKKLPYLQRATTKLDLAKLFLQIIWEIKSLDEKKYIAISEELVEIGNMLGGWMRQSEKTNPAR